MSTVRRNPLPRSIFWSRLTRRLRLSSLRWRRTRLARKLDRAERRTVELMIRVDLGLLLVKELETREQAASLALEQATEAVQFRLTGVLPQLPPAPEKTELDRLLGL